MVAGVGDMVRTIEKIAASRLHRMNEEVERLDAYARELSRVLEYLSLAGATHNPLIVPRETGESVLVILGGNKGLVGGLHHALVARFNEHKREYTRIIAVGARVKQLLEEEHVVPDDYFEGTNEDVDSIRVTQISNRLFDSYRGGGWKKVDILYANYRTISRQEAAIEQYLPFTFQAELGQGEQTVPLDSPLPVFEPSAARVYDRFLDLYIRIRFYKLVLTSKLSELSARTIEMEHAASKADEMLGKIRHDYAKDRRANSTLKQLSSFQVSRMI